MNAIQGARVAALDFVLTKVADLIFDDFPFLVLSRDGHGENVLQFWCDKNAELDRWLLFRVGDQQLDAYLKGQKSLRDLILNPKAGLVFTQDISCKEGHVVETRITTPIELPLTYLPAEGSVYQDAPIPVVHGKRRSMKVAIDGDWEYGEWNQFPRLLREAYAFLSNLIYKSEAEALPQYPMNEGFSVVHLFGDLRRHLKPEHDIKIRGLSYASPGAFNFDVDTQVADHLLKMLSFVQSSACTAHEDYHFLLYILRKNEIRGKDARKFKLWESNPELDQQIGELAASLLRAMMVPNPAHLQKLAGSGFMTAKIALAYFRLITERLLAYCRDEKVRFPLLA